MDGRGLPIRGTVAVTGPLADLDGTILVPAGPHDPTDLARIVVLASDVAVVERLLPLLGELAAPADPQALSVTAASELVDVRAAVAGELGRFARQLLAVVLGAGLALTSIAVFGFTSLRRRELGRRRALGATRGHLVALVVTQTALVGAAGSTVGAIGATALLGDQLSPSFTVAIAVLTAGATIVAAVPPALAAAWRDPVTVLRQP
jgi:putative ABC transport system permease protein